ncbi:hypothetical protein ACHHYP_14639 [Achlya hypogyna]|uniref:Uncharacterized protein n=1 Tax=Achlya hypogyna TaxID=1202772 RepID=A0A1V9YCT6_ACHHY|nr:hypothetical protein ACHHYP_14639 [Achlya hypogyna]
MIKASAEEGSVLGEDRVEHGGRSRPRKGPRPPAPRLGNQHASSGDSDDVALLQAENASLRQRLADMERLFVQVEQKQQAEQTEALDEINELLKLAEMAKSEATTFNHNTARDKMRRDIETLQTILKKVRCSRRSAAKDAQAKAERNDFKKAIKQSEEKLRLEMEKKKEEGLKSEIDQEIFTRIIKEDRDKYRAHVVDLLDRIRALEKQKFEVFLWAKQNQELYIQEMRKLTRAFAKVKRLSDEGTHEAKIMYEDACRLKQVILMDGGDLFGRDDKEDDARSAAFVLENAE